MVAGPSHAPEHHEAHGQPAANNAMHFNNGGLLGIMESVARLTKGITYDAAAETFGGGHGGHGGHAEHGAHGAEAHGAAHGAAATHGHEAPHGEAGHGAAHGADAHGAAGHGEAGHGATHAEGAHGHDDDDKDLSDKLIAGLIGMGTYGTGFAFLGKALDKAKKTLFPEIHEITVDHDHLGDQILHKLKKDKAAAKKKKLALDHHALEGFCQGIDIANLGTTLKMFTNQARFSGALDRDSGKEEIKKEIANLLKLTGDVDRDEVEKATEMLIQLLGGHIEGGHGHEHIGFHSLDSRVQAKHKALTDIVKNARAWLTPGALAKIYGYEKKEADYDMNYAQVGDRILKLNDKTLKPFLNRIKIDGIDDIEIAVGDLLNASNLATELTHNPDDLREQISNLFNVKGNVTAAKLKERKEQMEKKLQYVDVEEEVDDPAGGPGAKKKVMVKKKVGENTSFRDEVVKLIDSAYTNLIVGDTLAKLYPPSKEDEPTISINHAELGKAMLAIRDEKARAIFARSVDIDQANDLFEPLSDFTNFNDQLASGPKEVAGALRALFGLTGGVVTRARIEKARDVVLARLGKTHPVSAGTDALTQVAYLIDQVDAAFEASGVSAIIEKEDKPWAITYSQFGTYVLSEVHTTDDQASFLRAYQDRILRSEFPSLFPTSDIPSLMTEKGGRQEVRKELVDLFGLKGRAINMRNLEGRYTAILDQLGDGAVEASKFASVASTFESILGAVRPYAEKIFAVEAGPFEVNNFGRALEAIEEPADIVAFLRGFNKNRRQVTTVYRDFTNADLVEAALEDEPKRKILAVKLHRLLGLEDTAELTLADLTMTFEIYRKKLGAEEDLPDAETQEAHRDCLKLMEDVENVLKEENRVVRIMNGNEIVANYAELGLQIRRLQGPQLIELLDNMEMHDLAQFAVLRDPTLRTRTLNPGEVDKFVEKLKSFLGIRTGEDLNLPALPYIIRDLHERLGSLPNLRAYPQASGNREFIMLTLQNLSGLNFNSIFQGPEPEPDTEEMEDSSPVERVAAPARQERVELSAEAVLEPIKKRSLALRINRGKENEWHQVEMKLNDPKDLQKLSNLEKEGGQPAFIGYDARGNILFAEMRESIAPETKGTTYFDARGRSVAQGYDLPSFQEYKMLLSTKKINANEESWLKGEERDRNAEYIKFDTSGTPTIGVAAIDNKADHRGYRRVLRIASRREDSAAA